jgi:predicted ArsR family transcriptional regulator
MNNTSTELVKNLDVNLERDIFLRTLIRELSGTLQDVVGIEEASGFISVVGQNMGNQINYKQALNLSNLSREQVIEVLINLKKRIQGDFYVLEQTEDKIIFGNRTCPFAEKVHNRPAMCMMTSNVFGSIVADNLGYAKVELQKTIARGDSGCTVVIYLKPTEEAEDAVGREYFRGMETV